jgi:TonB family protein
MTTSRSANRLTLFPKLIVALMLSVGVTVAAGDKPKYDLPEEIQSLSRSSRLTPPRTVLDFDSTANAIADTAIAVVWLRFKMSGKGELRDIEVIYSSHPNYGLENRAIEALKATVFEPMSRTGRQKAKWLYYEVVFDRDFARRAAVDGEAWPNERDSTEYLPEPDEFVAIERYPEMIEYGRPEYPLAAKSAGITGVVWVKSLIDRKGVVQHATVGKSSGNALLDEAAVAAGYKCKFKPGIQNGHPIACWATYKVEFTIKK